MIPTESREAFSFTQKADKQPNKPYCYHYPDDFSGRIFPFEMFDGTVEIN
jgi:hypothetical protein